MYPIGIFVHFYFCTTFTCCSCRHKHCFIQSGCQRSIQPSWLWEWHDLEEELVDVGVDGGRNESQAKKGPALPPLEKQATGSLEVACIALHFQNNI